MGHPSDKQSGPILRASASLIVEGRVLLLRQEKGLSTYWLLPGGGVERGETLEATVVREFAEECSLNVAVHSPPLALIESISPDGGTLRHGVELVFAATLRSCAHPAPRANDPAIKEVRWVDEGELRSLTLHPPIADLVAEWLRLFAQGLPDPWPPLSATGVRWLPA